MLLLLWSLVAKKKKLPHLLQLLHLPSLKPPLLLLLPLLPPTRLLPPLVQHLLPLVQHPLLSTQSRLLKKLRRSKLNLSALS
ncbi:hypothetical protein SBP18_06950 [Rhodoferax ferrireducens]|uniref:hypothetical protein n=1 Tax=Rhodoferax ferrireducens TaxID=192843 RepID=UPI00298DC88D|nr:hypothetical protein [Rhodoferax ferrireducens]WPC68236.1 hypothetical protein SBP18_06950 [Rhodoferax ferrireducens]